MIEVPVAGHSSQTGASETTTMQIPIIDVDKLLRYIHEEMQVQCPVEKVQQYWQHLQSVGMPFAKNHPGSIDHIPFSLYGDEAVIGNDPHDKVLALFLSLPLFRPNSVRQGQFLIFAIHDELCIKENMQTMHPVLMHVVKTANRAFDAMQGPRWACTELKGDWKFHELWLRLSPTPVSKRPCWLCDAEASDTPMRYYETGTTNSPPLWAQTEVSTAGFITKKLRDGVTSAMATHIFNLPMSLDTTYIIIIIMHSIIIMHMI